MDGSGSGWRGLVWAPGLTNAFGPGLIVVSAGVGHVRPGPILKGGDSPRSRVADFGRTVDRAEIAWKR